MAAIFSSLASPPLRSRASRGRVLVVEPDASCADAMHEALADEGYEVFVVRGAGEAKAKLADFRPDLILTELTLPDADGLLFCADVAQRAQAPLVVCTTQNTKQARMLCFRLGAEDFISKPYDVDELAVRVDAVMRRAAERAALQQAAEAARESPRLAPAMGGLSFNRLLSQAYFNGERLPLTPAEYRILAVLMTRPNAPISRPELARLALGYEHVDGTRGVDMHVRRLRAKLAAAGVRGVSLVSVRGVGYRLISAGPRTHYAAA